MTTTKTTSSRSKDWSTLRAMVRDVTYDDSTFATDADQHIFLAWEAVKRQARHMSPRHSPLEAFSDAWLGIQHAIRTYPEQLREMSLREFCAQTAHFRIFSHNVFTAFNCVNEKDYRRSKRGILKVGLPHDAVNIPAPAAAPEENTREAMFSTMTRGLPAKYREMARMHYLEGRGMREIGTAMGVSFQRVHQVLAGVIEHASNPARMVLIREYV